MRTIRATAETVIHAQLRQVRALFADFRRWPQVFPATILSVQFRRHGTSLVEVMVRHRHEGDVINVLSFPSPDVIELREFKGRFDAVFVNRFLPSPEGTRYVIDAAVRLKGPFAILAPFLRGVVTRAIHKYTLAPMRAAAETPMSENERGG